MQGEKLTESPEPFTNFCCAMIGLKLEVCRAGRRLSQTFAPPPHLVKSVFRDGQQLRYNVHGTLAFIWEKKHAYATTNYKDELYKPVGWLVREKITRF